jgi:hypothetical protein
MNSPTEEQIKKAESFIARDPARAAYQLAEFANRLDEAEKALAAVRAFSQNTWLARDASQVQIEAALGRKFQMPIAP